MDLISLIHQELVDLSSEKVRQQGQHYFKEEAKIIGVKAPVVHAVSKRYLREIKKLPKQQIIELCEELWKSGWLEETQIASSWMVAIKKQLVPDDIYLLERWIYQYVNNWASCDSLCPKTVGHLLEKYPELVEVTKTWAKHPNMWLRRAAAVSYIYPAKHGLYLTDMFEIAETMMHAPEDLVQKGYGWMLKVAGDSFQYEVFTFVMKHKAHMPRTALRYAIEKFPDDLKKEAMAK